MIEEINRINERLDEMRIQYVTASPAMKKYLIARAKQLKDKMKSWENTANREP